MSLQVELLEKSMAKLTIEVSEEEFEKAVEASYQHNKGKFNIQGFRKGKTPRKIIEKMYGEEVFYEDAANQIIPKAYSDEIKDCDVDIVSQPDIDVTQIGKGKSFIFTATVAVKPEITLGDYKGIEIEKINAEVTDEEVEKDIQATREQNARTVVVEDRAAQDGDIAVIDFEGFVDGEAFDGGKGTDYPLTIGSHSFIDNFEEQIIGKSVSEEVFDVNVTFPEEYQAKELAGKPAVFKVTLKELKAKELPELDDEFAQDVSEFDTIDEYKADVRATLEKKKADAAKTEKENKVVDKIIENATIEIPAPMKDTQVKQMAGDFEQRVKAQGLSVEQYLQFTGMTKEKFLESLEPKAEQRIQSRLVLEAIAKAENIQISDEEYEEELKEMAENYKMELDKIKELIGERERKDIELDMAVKKAIDFVVDSAVEK